jgi:hypothetical protein
MKKYKYLLAGFSLFFASTYIAKAQYHEVYDRYGIYGSLGINSINGSVESKSQYMQSLKGSAAITPVIGGYYEMAVDKNMSFIFNLGLGYTKFGYSYVGEYKSLLEIKNDSNVVVGIVPDGPGETIKRNLNVLMAMPHLEISLQSNPIKETLFLDLRLGVGAGIYLSSHDVVYGNYHIISKDGAGGDYIYSEIAEVGNGKRWASTYSSLYLGARWRNTTSDFMNRSTIGLQFLLPFDNPRSGGASIDYQAVSWTQQFQKESIKFRLNTIGLKYTYNFGRLFEY